MRFSIVSVMLMSLACANVQVGKTNSTNPDFSGLQFSASKNDGYYVPKIVFEGPVDAESVAQTQSLMDVAVRDGAAAVVIEWNTPGGSVFDGFLLAKTIEESSIPVICVVDMEAASMGAFLLQSCHVRIMTKRSNIMIHEAAVSTGSFGGHEVSWRNIADRLKAINKSLVEHMAKRMLITPEAMADKIRGGAQWWLDWEEAVKFGAVDLVVDSVVEVTTPLRTCGQLSC